MNNLDSLEDYLIHEMDRGAHDFMIRSYFSSDKRMKIKIHPYNKSGITKTYEVVDNELECVGST